MILGMCKTVILSYFVIRTNHFSCLLQITLLTIRITGDDDDDCFCYHE